MKTHKFTEDEMKLFNFHIKVINFHDLVIKNYVTQIATNRLKVDAKNIQYDLNKKELYVLGKKEKKDAVSKK